MKKNIKDILFIFITIGLLFLLSIYILVKPVNEKSVEENRFLTSFRNLKESSFLDGSFQKIVEDSYTDQFPKRSFLVSIKKKSDDVSKNMVLPKMTELTLNRVSGQTINRLGNTSYMINMIIEATDINKERFKSRALEINDLQTRHPNVDIFVYVPTQAHETSLFDKDSGITAGAPELWQIFENNIKVPFKRFDLNSFDLYKQAYYKSDHHPTHIGSDIFYNEIMNLINPSIETLKPISTDCHVGKTFYGTFGSRTGFIYEPDEFCVYHYDIVPYDVYLKGELAPDYTYRKDFESFDPKSDNAEHPYYYNIAYKVYDSSEFEHYDSLMIFDTKRPDLDNILVIGDSYSSSVIDLIASHYNKTFRMLPYNEVIFNGKMFDYDNFIIDYDIDIVLFMYTAENYYYVDEWADRYEQTRILPNGGNK